MCYLNRLFFSIYMTRFNFLEMLLWTLGIESLRGSLIIIRSAVAFRSSNIRGPVWSTCLRGNGLPWHVISCTCSISSTQSPILGFFLWSLHFIPLQSLMLTTHVSRYGDAVSVESVPFELPLGQVQESPVRAIQGQRAQGDDVPLKSARGNQ